MMVSPSSPWLGPGLAAVAFLASAGGTYAARPSYCPERCSVAGPNSGNWSAYPDFRQLDRCPETKFLNFALYDPIDNNDVSHRILACTSYGPDFVGLAPSSASDSSSESSSGSALASAAASSIDVSYEIGWWDGGYGPAKSAVRSLVSQVRPYLEGGHGPTRDDNRPLIMFGQFGATNMGLYVGQALQREGLSTSALKLFQDFLSGSGDVADSSPSVAVQLCGPGLDSAHIFGLVAISDGTWTPVQEAVKTWANASCLSFVGSTEILSTAVFTAPLLNATMQASLTRAHGNLTFGDDGSSTSLSGSQPSSSVSEKKGPPSRSVLHARADCHTIQVVPGDSCAALAQRCGISGVDFTSYNPGSDFCSKLVPKQHVCCSKGNLPDFRPQPKSDGSCASYKVTTGDNCGDIAAQNSLTIDDLEDFNKNTWGWNGCKRLLIDTIMCISNGAPPFPAPMANAICGPQVPDTKPPTDGTKLADLNPCPLNACCDVWGQCGTTREFCVDTGNGAPGTAKAGTNGCISNCGTDIVKGKGDGAQRVAYFQGYGLSRDCLYQDAAQIDTSKYTHIHYGFATLTSAFEVKTGDIFSSYEFQQFKLIRNAKRILSFGGWAFSTEPATYAIFREGVTPANRVIMAGNIANFIIENGLDGVDIDWEYPGAPDIPGIPPGGKDDGLNYLAFLVVLKNLLGPHRSVSIAAPSSYWYLKQYPIATISKVIDYIVYMTYDLHGQWDAGNSNSQVGCDTGNCLRSQVNLTETQNSLSMITKAGVAAEKVVVGITSYGRSFRMAQAGCHGPDCTFIGGNSNSQAAPGVCTAVAGILANAEIDDIIAGTQSWKIDGVEDANGNSTARRARGGGRVTASYVEPTSNSRVLVYDNVEWVDYMDDSIKTTRQALYKAWGFAGTTDWATDLQRYHDPPVKNQPWRTFRAVIKQGRDPRKDWSRNGDWTSYNCSDPRNTDPDLYTPSELWNGLDADDAWADIVRIWQSTDRAGGDSFTVSVASTIRYNKPGLDCTQVNFGGGCKEPIRCEDLIDPSLSGPAGSLIWNSLVQVNILYSNLWLGIANALTFANGQLNDLQTTFAPYPPPPDTKWIYFLVDIVTLGATSVFGPFFNSFLNKLPAFVGSEEALNNLKDTTMTLTGQATSIAKDLYAPLVDGKWTPDQNAKFDSFLATSVSEMQNSISKAITSLFDGSDASIAALGKIIADGKMINNKGGIGHVDNNSTIVIDEKNNILKTIFAFAIPSIWYASKTGAFVLDSGYGCDEADDKMTGFLTRDTMKQTGFCVPHGNKYYLVEASGDSQTCICEHGTIGGGCSWNCADSMFPPAQGIAALGRGRFGNITKEELIKGSVKTYAANGYKNILSPENVVDPTDPTLQSGLLAGDYTAAGTIRIPVCNGARAFQSWSTSRPGSSDNYPCDIPPGVSYCNTTASTYNNEVSGASPLVEDCKQMLRNIEGDAKTSWLTGIGSQRQILQYRTCKFGVQNKNSGHNSVTYQVGGQDVIDIVKYMIAQYPGERVGGQGNMKCRGNNGQITVKWGLY